MSLQQQQTFLAKACPIVVLPSQNKWINKWSMNEYLLHVINR